MAFTAEQIALLSAPLSRDHVKTRTMAGRQMSYIEGWKAIAEANRIFGFDGWCSETILLQETNRELVDLKSNTGSYKQWRIGYIAKVRITVGNTVREGTGYGSGMGKPENVGDAVEGAIKEAETDARKRALMTFGSPLGLALYDKEQSEVADSQTPASEPPKPSAAISHNTASEDPDGQVKAWVEQQVGIIKSFKTLPELTGWLDKSASTNGENGDLTKPSSGSPLDRLRRKSPDHFAVIKAQYMQKLAMI